MKVTIEWEEGDFNPLHDILYDLVGHSFEHKELLGFWKHLPQDIKDSAIHWGLDDTPVRDDMYTFFKNEFKKLGVEHWEQIRKDLMGDTTLGVG